MTATLNYTPATLRRAEWLLEQMADVGPLGIERDDLVRRVNLRRTTVYDLLNVLMRQARVIRITMWQKRGRGRPRVRFVPVTQRATTTWKLSPATDGDGAWVADIPINTYRERTTAWWCPRCQLLTPTAWDASVDEAQCDTCHRDRELWLVRVVVDNVLPGTRPGVTA